MQSKDMLVVRWLLAAGATATSSRLKLELVGGSSRVGGSVRCWLLLILCSLYIRPPELLILIPNILPQ